VVVGESPGYEEEVRRPPQPFVGRAGVLARELATEAGLNWSEFFITNSARCRIIKDDLSTKEVTSILNNCRPNLVAVLKQLKPACIILFGDFALRQVLRTSGITKTRGRWVWSKEFQCWCLPTFHPAYILRNPAQRPYVVGDLQKVADFKNNGFEFPKEEGSTDYHLDAVDVHELIAPGSMTGFDTEDQGLDWMSPNFVLISFSVSDEKGRAYNVNLYEEVPVADAEFTITWPRKQGRQEILTKVGVKRCAAFDRKVAGLKAYLADSSIKKYMMNGNFDLHALGAFFRRIGESWTIKGYVMDIQAAAHVLDENMYKMASLEDLQEFFTDVKENYNREFGDTFNKADMLAIPAADRSLYACKDADVTRRVAMALREQLGRPENRRLAVYYARVVHRSLIETLFTLEERGAWIDQEVLPVTTKQVKERFSAEAAAAVKLIPKKVRELPTHKEKGLALSRTDLIRDVLFNKEVGFKLKPYKNTKSKNPSVDKESRKMLLAGRMSKGCREFLNHYEQWTELHTLWSRYLKGFAAHVKIDGRIHSSYSLATAVTGRVASSNPNMMNNPKRSASAKLIRRLIAAPKGWLLMPVDQSQSELRWAAHVSGCKAMIDVFAKGEDIHTNTAKSMVRNWDAAPQEARAVARRNAKPVNFGMLFLMSAPGLVQYAKIEYGVDMTEEEAKRYIALWFDTYPELRTYHRKTIEFCRKNGYVESPLGRRRRLPEINSSEGWQKAEAERMAVNHPIQNPSSDVVLMASNELIREGKLNPEECFPILFVHDELIFQIRDNSRVEDNARIVKESMENPPLERDLGIRLLVPLKAEVKIGPDLANTHELLI
jgi:uracil-DNA glycosylase family 4